MQADLGAEVTEGACLCLFARYIIDPRQIWLNTFRRVSKEVSRPLTVVLGQRPLSRGRGLSLKVSFFLVKHAFKSITLWEYLGVAPRVSLVLPVVLGSGCVAV